MCSCWLLVFSCCWLFVVCWLVGWLVDWFALFLRLFGWLIVVVVVVVVAVVVVARADAIPLAQKRPLVLTRVAIALLVACSIGCLGCWAACVDWLLGCDFFLLALSRFLGAPLSTFLFVWLLFFFVACLLPFFPIYDSDAILCRILRFENNFFLARVKFCLSSLFLCALSRFLASLLLAGSSACLLVCLCFCLLLLALACFCLLLLAFLPACNPPCAYCLLPPFSSCLFWRRSG